MSSEEYLASKKQPESALLGPLELRQVDHEFAGKTASETEKEEGDFLVMGSGKDKGKGGHAAGGAGAAQMDGAHANHGKYKYVRGRPKPKGPYGPYGPTGKVVGGPKSRPASPGGGSKPRAQSNPSFV